MILILISFVKVYISKNDYNAMRAEVCRHQNIETGGSLFGLWTTSGSAVIHVVLGPGKNCRRTTTSFHQDIEYMKRVGRFVYDKYMVCHIGEWHSHHSLSSNKPNCADEQTARRNFLQGVTKFLVIIANIENRNFISLSPYFFTDEGRRYEKAEIVILDSDGPFSNDDKILQQIQLGAEGGNEFEQSKTSYSGGFTTTREIPTNTHSNFPPNVNACPTYSQAVSRGFRETSHNAGLNAQSRRDNNTSSTHSQATSINSQPFRQNTNTATSTDTYTKPQEGGSTPPADNQTTAGPPEFVQSQTVSGEDEKASMKEITLKKINDELRKYFGNEGNIDIERTSNGDIQMTFKHDLKYWRLRFTENFPNRPAQLFSTYHDREHLSDSSPLYLLEEPLTNHVNILLSIKKNCYLSCRICKSISKEDLTKPATAKPGGNTSLKDAVAALKNELEMTGIATPLSFFGDDQSYRIKFRHNSFNWLITFPPEFSDKPAEVYKQEDRYRAVPVKVHYFSNTKHKEVPLVLPDHIMSAIISNCDCPKCKSKKR